MKTYLIPLFVATIIILGYFSISQTIIQDQNLSKQCAIPHDVNFVDRIRVISGPNDGKPHYSIDEEFSIFYTVPIGEFRVDDISHSLILKPVPTSHGYIIMCDPLPVLEKRFDTKMNGIVILVDNEEIGFKIVENVLKINVNRNTLIEIVGFSQM